MPKKTKELLKKPEEWQSILGFQVMDPDGWRHDDKSWEDEIAQKEFEIRASKSTCRRAWSELLKSKNIKKENKPIERKKRAKVQYSNQVALFACDGDDSYRFVDIFDKNSELEMPEFDIMVPLPLKDSLPEFDGF